MIHTLTIPRLMDLHVHLRDDSDGRLRYVAGYTAQYCNHALVMPNLKPIVHTAEDVMRYKQRIYAAVSSTGHSVDLFTPLMTIYINDQTTPQIIRDAAKAGVVAGKLYPAGVTTGSEAGSPDPTSAHLMRVYEEMARVGMVLCIHGEKPGDDVDIFDAESLFLASLEKIALELRNLKIVLEHITTKVAAQKVAELRDGVAATITPHHLAITRNDLLRPNLRPHYFCMPVAKRFEDRTALWNAVEHGGDKFFLGSDSAPHTRNTKECAAGCAGIFTAPILPHLLAHLFDKHGQLAHLEDFATHRGAAFYGLPQSTGTLTLVRKPFLVPDVYPGNIVPFMAGETLNWSVSA